MQIQTADTIILNKVDLVSEIELKGIEQTLQSFNESASFLPAKRCQVDVDLLFGIVRDRIQEPPHHVHQPEFESFSYTTSSLVFIGKQVNTRKQEIIERLNSCEE